MRNALVTQLFFSIGFLFSCSQSNEDFMKRQLVRIDVQESEVGGFTDFVDRMDYFLVRTRQPNLLVSPYKIVARDSVYFIQDFFQKKIFKYDKFLNSYKTYGKAGEGPLENMELDDFMVQDDSIFIYDSKLRKFLTYSEKSNYVKEEKGAFYRSLFYWGRDFKLVYSHNDPEVGFRIVRIDNNGDTQAFISIEKWFEKKITRNPTGFILDERRNKIYFLLPYTNEVAIFNSSGILEQLVHFDLGSYAFGEMEYTRFPELRGQLKHATDNNLILQIGVFLPLKNGFLVSFNQEGNGRHWVFLDDDMNVKAQFKDPKNDIDSSAISAMPWASYGNKVVLLANSKRWFSENEEKSLDWVSSNRSNVLEFWKENQDFLFEDEHQILIELTLSEAIF